MPGRQNNEAEPSLSSSGPNRKPPPEVQARHIQMLIELAKRNDLKSLLTNPTTLLELGIPRKKLEDILRDDNKNGLKGLNDFVKPLLYTTGQYTLPVVYSRSTVDNRSSRSIPSSSNGNGNGSGNGNGTSDGNSGSRTGSGATSTNASIKEEGKKSISDLLRQHNIELPKYTPGTYRLLCPKCNGGSKAELSFSVTIDEDARSARWYCFRATCGYAGGGHVDRATVVNDSGFMVSTMSRKRKEEPPVRPKVNFESLSIEQTDLFHNRGIFDATIARNKISSEVLYDPVLKKESRVIAFPYYRDGVLVNVKYRTMDKRFWQVRGAEKILYGLDDIVGAQEIVIVEGEMDKLALEEAGITNVVSVPDGAPARPREGDLPPAHDDTKFSYLWNCRSWLDQAVRIVIATDNDAPGDALAEELARRLGRERCWRVRWPLSQGDHEYVAGSFGIDVGKHNSSDSSFNEMPPMEASAEMDRSDAPSAENASSSIGTVDSLWYRKDANDVLISDGPVMLRAFVQMAEPLPIRGLLRFHEYYDDIVKHFFHELRDAQSFSTGWPSLDQYYKVIPGELTIVTGVPNSGKSEWIDALLCNLSELHGWTFALCSMEKRAPDHARQLAEKLIGKPFFDLSYARGIPRMNREELDAALDWIDDRFHLVRYEDDQLPSVDWVLDIAKAAVYRYGVRGLVIDPYNELDHQRPSHMTETEYVSQMLTKVKRFAQTAGVHVWFVAHPRQMRDWKGHAPNLYDISGSAHFINKADNGIVVHRNREPGSPSGAEVQILVRKVRNKMAGTIGDCSLMYERVNGRYIDVDDATPPQTSRGLASPSWATSSSLESRDMLQAHGLLYVHADGTVNSDPPESP